MSEQQATPETATKALPGGALRGARETLGLTVHQVAAKLNLSPRVIEQMENNLLTELGAPVYAKGYLRQYAQLAGCAEETILSSYLSVMGQQELADPVPISVTHHAIPTPRRPLPGWALWCVAVMIILAVVAVLMNLEPQQAAAAKHPFVSAASVPAPASATSSGDSTSPLATVMARAKAAPVAEAEGAVAEESSRSLSGAEVSNAQPTGGAEVELALAFSGDSWMEIYDARRQKVMYDMNHKGDVRQVRGAAPLSVLMGSASQVSMAINGRKVSVPTQRGSNDVARFTISGTGEIQ